MKIHLTEIFWYSGKKADVSDEIEQTDPKCASGDRKCAFYTYGRK